MKKVLKKNKFKIIFVIMAILFTVILFEEINRYNIIPDHLHSIDDKPSEERTDIENITVLERSLQKDPNNVNILIQLSDLYIKTDNKKLAKKTLGKILEIDPLNKEINERLRQLD